MFTGIVQGTAKLVSATRKTGLFSYTFDFGSDKSHTQCGASVAINGCCLTVTHAEGNLLSFDLMAETLGLTNLKDLNQGDLVNYEHAAKMGDEVGGHVLSGHIHCLAEISKINQSENNLELRFSAPDSWTKYIFNKGYIAINGASLTIGDVKNNQFSVYLIPETLRITTFADLAEGSRVNIEVDAQTQAIVDTLERLLPEYLAKLKSDTH